MGPFDHTFLFEFGAARVSNPRYKLLLKEEAESQGEDKTGNRDDRFHDGP